MTTASITVEQLSKRYRLGGSNFRFTTLRDKLSGLFSKRDEPKNADAGELWALRDVNLEVQQGEAIGLIGHNGAGKSTLLKILSRITEPTSGRAIMRGRLASLLEVGTGFHPELTGRENIFLNGAILGMSRSEIRHNFDAIVAFAEIERFLDTPVKRYSSGMYVRLAFAVAAHLTPEILLVDEVLAVGDIDFQRRCLGRMDEVARSGRTVVFVSHNLGSIEALCPRSVLMRAGTVAMVGPTRDVLANYLSRRGGESLWDLRGFAEREGSGRARLTDMALLTADGTNELDVIEFRQPFRIRLAYETNARVAHPAFGLALLTEKNERVVLTNSEEGRLQVEAIEGTGHIDCVLPEPNLLPGIYYLEAWITDPVKDDFADHVRMVGKVEIVVGENVGDNVAALTTPDRGHIWLRAQWT